MKTKLVYLSILSSTILFSSCATIFCGSKKSIVLESNIKEAQTVTVDGFKYKDVSFPFSVKIRRGFNETIVKAEAKGYQPSMLMINKNFNAVSVINLTDILGWGIDAATGAMMKPEFNSYELEFIPEENQK